MRGAPCGATWEAARRVIHLAPEEAVVRIGLEVQYFCSADPAGWDPIHGKSPVHFAGHVHSAALRRALQKSFTTASCRRRNKPGAAPKTTR